MKIKSFQPRKNNQKEKEIEKVWNRVSEELKYVATYASPERREELLRFLQDQFLELLTSYSTELEKNNKVIRNIQNRK